MPGKLLADLEKWYVAAEGAACPFCGNKGIEGDGPIEADGPEAWQPVRCLQCEGHWLDGYRLTSVRFTPPLPMERFVPGTDVGEPAPPEWEPIGPLIDGNRQRETVVQPAPF
jgi:hypothetical protein